MTIAKSRFLELKKNIENSPYQKTNIKRSKSISISYLNYRIMRPLIRFRYKRYQKSNPTHPWLSPDSINIFEQLLNKNMIGLEYGSGRSTIFLSKLLKHLVSVEHNQEWFNQVTKLLHQKNLKNVDLNLIAPDTFKPMPKLSSENDAFISADEFPISDSYYKSYVDFISSFEDNYFGFILIDGRARVSCSMKALDKLKPGGLFVLDNSERRRYGKVHKALETWPTIFTTTGHTDTVIWRKP